MTVGLGIPRYCYDHCILFFHIAHDLCKVKQDSAMEMSMAVGLGIPSYCLDYCLFIMPHLLFVVY